MEIVSTPNAPKPAGHYSQGIVHNPGGSAHMLPGLVFVSGQLPINPGDGSKCLGSIEEQMLRTLQNVEAVLRAAGSSKDQVLKTTVYISNIELWGRANAVYADFFGTHRPARAIVPTRELHYGFLVEIEAIAAVDPIRTTLK